MQMDLPELKQNLWRWYLRVSAFWMLQTVLFYFAACFVAGKPIGPVEYVRFQYHVIQWRPQRAAGKQVASVNNRECSAAHPCDVTIGGQ